MVKDQATKLFYSLRQLTERDMVRYKVARIIEAVGKRLDGLLCKMELWIERLERER